MKILIALLIMGTMKLAPSAKVILALGLEELNMNHVTIIIQPIKPEMVKDARKRGADIRAHVTGQNGQYTIRLNKVRDWELLKVLAHELIHIKQLETKKLIVMSSYYLVYKGRRYGNYQVIPYSKRPWEIDALREGDILKRKITKKMRQ